jgi:hypothetical protein
MRLLIAGGNQMPAIFDADRDGTVVNWSDYGDDMRES